MAQPFDPRRLELSGDAVPIAEQVFIQQGFSASSNGKLAYRAIASQANQLTWMDRSGKITATAAPPGIYNNFRLAPDDKRIAFNTLGDVWVMDLVRGVKGRVYPIGRLDYASEGLLLLTNDGDLAHRLMKAASHVSKTYLVKVAGTPKEEALAKLRGGVSIATDEGRRARTAPAAVKVVKEAANPWYEITLIEGRNRQIRRMFEAVGHHVEKIKRVRYGPLTLDVPPGRFRALTLREIERLKSATKSGAAGRTPSV